MVKHAWLIIAHNQLDHLKKILNILDDNRNDIYLHIDKKTHCEEDKIKNYVQYAGISLINRSDVRWGGYSLIKVELDLLRTATANGPYQFYHLISGSDYFLKTQNEIQNFFNEHQNTEFISLSTNESIFIDRIKYYYWFQEILGEGFWGRAFRKIALISQKILRINRCKYGIHYGIGSQFFDITDKFARYVLSKEEWIEKNFKYSWCADEIFLQTLFLNSDFKKRYENPVREYPCTQDIYLDVMRMIDWGRGSPYVWKTKEDYMILKKSGCLIARKFDYEKYPEIVDRLEADIVSVK